MTVKQLIEELQNCDPDAQVTLQTQEDRPLESRIMLVTESFEDEAVWIVEGDQIGRGTKSAWE